MNLPTFLIPLTMTVVKKLGDNLCTHVALRPCVPTFVNWDNFGNFERIWHSAVPKGPVEYFVKGLDDVWGYNL